MISWLAFRDAHFAGNCYFRTSQGTSMSEWQVFKPFPRVKVDGTAPFMGNQGDDE